MARSFFTGEAHQSFDLHAGPVGALLIHGFMGSPKEMRPLAHALVEAGVSARGVQLPGFGPDRARLETVRVGYTRRLTTRLGGPLVLHEVAAGHLLGAADGPAWPTVRDLVTRFAMAAGMEDG